MPRAKRRKKTGGWGGRRKGAGRKPKLLVMKRQNLVSDYFALKQILREKYQKKPPYRDEIIQELMNEHGVSRRMVERCLAEYLPQKRRQHKDYLLEQKRKRKNKRAGGKKL